MLWKSAAELEKDILERLKFPVLPADVLQASIKVLMPFIEHNSYAMDCMKNGKCRSWRELEIRANMLLAIEPEIGNAFYGVFIISRANSRYARRKATQHTDANWIGDIAICRLCWRPASGGLTGQTAPACHIHAQKKIRTKDTKNPIIRNRWKEYKRAARALSEFNSQIKDIRIKRFDLKLEYRYLPQSPTLEQIAEIYPNTVEYVRKLGAENWKDLLMVLLEVPDYDPAGAAKNAITALINKIIDNPAEGRGWLTTAEAWLRVLNARPHSGGKRVGAGRPKKSVAAHK